MTVAVGPRPGFDLRFDDCSARCGGGRRLEFHHFRLQRHHLEQLVDPGPFRGGDRQHNRFAAPIFRG